MASTMRRMGEYLGLVEQSEFDEESDDAVYAAPVPTASRPAPRPVTSLSERRPESVVAATDVSRIEKLTPRNYNDARPIGEAFRSGVPVIMNLSDISDDDAKRLVDFAAGLVFAVHGTINRITAKVFLLSPHNIEVSAEDKAVIAAGDFYNQS